MRTVATRVLRLALVPKRSATQAPAEDLLIEFVAYARESQLSGLVHLTADRLTDLLNATDELELLDVLCLGLAGGVAEADRVVVARDELVAVKAGEPRGRPSLRRPTRQVAVGVASGPYAMHGYMHGRPGADPMIRLGRRPPTVPLTDAVIAYEAHDGWRREDASTLIVNRDTADSIRPAREDEVGRLGRQWGAA
jgi:hypothetical protein